MEKETAIIEAILFLETEPIDLRNLARISKLDKDVVLQALEELQARYSREEHGLEVAELGGGFVLTPKKELWDYLKDRYGRKKEEKLSRAALETLSIIAYSQPMTRAEVENIRGVSASGMIKLLLDKGMIREVGKKDLPGKPIQYGTTKEFLKAFRLSSISDLPKLEEREQDRFQLNG